MMNREMRKTRIKDQAKDSKWIDPFSEEEINEFFKNRDGSSEARFLKVLDPKEAAKVFAKEALALEKDFGLETIIATDKNAVPVFDDDIRFEYIIAVEDFKSRLDDGGEAVAVFISEESKVIAFGTASKNDQETEIEVIEVEINSSRRAGLSKEIEIENLQFTIGVAHLVLLKLLEYCRSSIWSDATNESSRYVFKSLGFVPDEGNANPCILRKEG